MAHPNKRDASASHSDKLHRMTTHYGSAAGPSANKLAPTNRLKGEGPEENVGFGADASAAKARGDRAPRRTQPANPLATYAKGGKVAARARGGRTKGKGKGATHVNVIVSPQGMSGNQPMVPPPVVPLGAGAPPMAPPMAPAAAMPPRPLMGMPPGAGMPMAPGAPGGIPPGIIPPRAKGGRVKHADEKEDKALIMKTLKDQGLIHSVHRARGGKVPSHMTAGAESGPGRLEKTAWRERNARHEKPQEV
jgi:hypothetical protein